MNKKSLIVLVAATTAGLFIAWVDSRPNWDDTGITVLMILSASALFGYLSPKRPWLIALAVSVWIPLLNIILSSNYGTLLAIIPGFAGAWLGFTAKMKL